MPISLIKDKRGVMLDSRFFETHLAPCFIHVKHAASDTNYSIYKTILKDQAK